MLLKCTAFAVAGIGMAVGSLLSLPFGSSRWDSPSTVVMGAVSVLFFGIVCGGAALHGSIHHRHALVLGPAGLRDQGGSLVPSHEVHGVILVPVARRQQVMLRLGPAGERAWLTGVAPAARWLQRLHRDGMRVPHLEDRDPYGLWSLLEHLRMRQAYGWR